MAALSTATPAMLTEAEKNAPAGRARRAKAAIKLPWRSLLGGTVLVLAGSLWVYALVHRGGTPASASHPAQPAQTALAAPANGTLVDVPLPSRRPAGLQAPQPPSRSEPAPAASCNDLSWSCLFDTGKTP
jgi:hypothetical protein